MPPGTWPKSCAVDAARRGNQTPPVQLADVEEVEGGDAAPGSFERQPCEQAAAQAQLDEARLLEGVAHEPGVFETVLAKGLSILMIGAENELGHGFFWAGLGELAAAEHRLRHCFEAIVVKALWDGSKQVHGIQHLTAVDDHAASAPNIAFPIPRGVAAAAEIEGQSEGFSYVAE